MANTPQEPTQEELQEYLHCWTLPGGRLTPEQTRALLAWDGTPEAERAGLEANLASTEQEVPAEPLAPNQRRGHVSWLDRLKHVLRHQLLDDEADEDWLAALRRTSTAPRFAQWQASASLRVRNLPPLPIASPRLSRLELPFGGETVTVRKVAGDEELRGYVTRVMPSATTPTSVTEGVQTRQRQRALRVRVEGILASPPRDGIAPRQDEIHVFRPVRLRERSRSAAPGFDAGLHVGGDRGDWRPRI